MIPPKEYFRCTLLYRLLLQDGSLGGLGYSLGGDRHTSSRLWVLFVLVSFSFARLLLVPILLLRRSPGNTVPGAQPLQICMKDAPAHQDFDRIGETLTLGNTVTVAESKCCNPVYDNV